MFRRTAFLLVVGVFIFAPFSASAANVNFFGPIVPDGTNGQPDCTCKAESTGFTTVINGETVGIDSAPNWACVLATVQNAVAVGISFILLMITLIIAYSGLMIIVQPDKPGHREEGKSMMMNAVLGLVIVLTAWLIVDFVMKALYNQTEAAATLGRAPDLAWNSIFSDDLDPANLCFAPRTADPGTDDGGGLNDPDTTPGTADAPPSNNDPVPAPPTPVSSTATPVAPSNFYVTGTGVSYIELSWAPAVTGVEKYQLDYTSTTKPGTQADSVVADDSTYKHLQTFGASAPGYFVHMGLQANTRYFYRLWAINGESPNWKYAKAAATGMTQTNTSSAPTAPTKVAVPGTPTGLTATAVGTTQVNVSWTPTSGATEYQLDLATGSGGEYALVAKVSGGATKTYTYTVKTPGTTHHFALWAKNSSGFSKKAATVSVSVGGGTTTIRPECSKRTGVDAEVCSRLYAGGVSINNTNACVINGQNVRYQDYTAQTGGRCTSVGGMKESAIKLALDIKENCGCTVILTGGSELGHSSKGTYNHGNGYKIDLGLNSSLNAFLESFEYGGEREGDSGGPSYDDLCGNIYVKESSHWDIVASSACGNYAEK